MKNNSTLRLFLLINCCILISGFRLTAGQTGNLWGINYAGGTAAPGQLARGNIYSIGKNDDNFSQRYCFTLSNDGGYPFGNLLQASDGLLYGMASQGGTVDGGILFNYDYATKTFVKLLDFGDGSNDANYPVSGLIEYNNLLYGMTASGGLYGGGVIFTYDIATQTYNKLVDIGDTAIKDGLNPIGDLLAASNGILYGTTNYGGIEGGGTLFSFDPLTLIYSKLLDFGDTTTNDASTPTGTLIQSSNGLLYGMTTGGGTFSEGVIYSFDPATLAYTKVYDFDGLTGSQPGNGSLVETAPDILFGMTYLGGANLDGNIFRFDASSNTLTDVYDFDSDSGAYNPTGGLLYASDNLLYGLTNNYTSIGFSFDPQTNNFIKLFDCDQTTGYQPQRDFMEADNGNLYAMCYGGGSSNAGIVFSYNRTTDSTYQEFQFFTSLDGYQPEGKPLLANDGKIYGAASGGSYYAGILFSLDTATNTYAKIHDFNNIDGKFCAGNLIQASDGKIYGATTDGGINDMGVLFSYDITTNTYLKLFDFYSEAGCSGGLLQFSDSILYGTANYGGDSSGGTMFKFNILTNQYTKVHDFRVTDGSVPNPNLALAEDGKIYGCTFFGGKYEGVNPLFDSPGVLFSFNPLNNDYEVLHDFGYSYGNYIYDGENPITGVTIGDDGKIYGAAIGGINEGGLFSYNPSSGLYTHPLLYTGSVNNIPRGSYLSSNDGNLYTITPFGTPSVLKYDPETEMPSYFTTIIDGNPLYTSGLAESITDHDAAAAAIVAPQGTVCSATINPVLRIRNQGSLKLTSATINYKFDNGTTASVPWSGNLLSKQSELVNLPAIVSTPGIHTITAYTTLPNGLTDQYADNDSSSSTFTIDISGQSLPLAEGFEGINFPPAGYSLYNPDHYYSWEPTADASHSGTNSLRIDNYEYTGINEIDDLNLPAVDLTTLATPYFTFWVAYRSYDNPSVAPFWADSLQVLISTDCGETYTKIYNKGGDDLATTVPHFAPSPFVPLPADWRSESLNLSAYASSNDAYIKIRNVCHFENVLYVDDINIIDATGIKNNDPESNVVVAPNPSNGLVNINIKSAEKGTVELTVSSVEGSQIIYKNYENSNYISDQIDLSGYSSGIYIIKVKIGNSLKVKKLIINH